MIRATTALALAFILTGCQSLPGADSSIADNQVLISAQHCLEESVGDRNRIHFGPCLKITDINGQEPNVRNDGFIALPAGQPFKIGTSCVYRHADGSPIPATMETTIFQVQSSTFPRGGQRWYLHAHEQARGVIGCKPTLARSKYPVKKTD